MPEKRRAHRVCVNIRAQYRSDAVSLEGWVANLSRHGVFLRTEYLDAEGTLASLDLDLPGAVTPLRLVGEVVRVDTTPLSSGMGIRFGQLEGTVLRELANLVIERSYQSLA